MPCHPALLLSLVLAVMAVTAAPPAEAEVRRCALPDGKTIFTDRRCEELGAAERLPRDESASSGLRRSYRGGCARNLQDLFYEVTSAIDGRDANRLASVYHWAGMSSADAYRTLARLDGIAQRPLVDLVPVTPSEPEPEPSARPTGSTHTVAPLPSAVATADNLDLPAFEPPVARARRAPVALRVEQTLANGTTPSRTVFGLRRHLGCWWLTG